MTAFANRDATAAMIAGNVNLSHHLLMQYSDIVQRSRSLPYRMPTTANQLAQLSDRAIEVEHHAESVRPIVHHRVVEHIGEFLLIKRHLGSPLEKTLYAEMGIEAFISRLLRDRPLAFLNSTDSFLLRDGTRGNGGFDAIGSEEEKSPLTLQQLLSYDEMAISALLGVSVPTHFINSGARNNCGEPGEPGSFEPTGVYVGLVGTRFERPGRMEWQHMMVSQQQNRFNNGYGTRACASEHDFRLMQAWASFYGEDHLSCLDEAQHNHSGRYLKVHNDCLLDLIIYQRRIQITVETYLKDANDRALGSGTKAYLHVVGLGLGVWRVDVRQTNIMVDAYAQVLRSGAYPEISDLNFSWFRNVESCGGVPDQAVFNEGGNAVRIHFSRRDPADRLTDDDEGKLLVAMYPWDSNAFPGNEYWGGALSASGDPAAACCSNIPELQNPDVNPRVSGRYATVFSSASGDPEPLTDVAVF